VGAAEQEMRLVIEWVQFDRSLQQLDCSLAPRLQIQAAESELAEQSGARQLAVDCVAGSDAQQLNSGSMVVTRAQRASELEQL
jgi:hypothetical protein